LPQRGQLAFGFVLVAAVEDHREQAEEGQDGADQEPDEEGAPLRLADDRGGEAEEEGESGRIGFPRLIVALRVVWRGGGQGGPNVQAGTLI